MNDLPQLRLALAMRGGVSLAVWIGGACREIDELCRCGEFDDGFWADLLTRSSYSGVAVDVIAGASAGGLNGVLFAASQQYGFDLQRVRELWLKLGSLDELARVNSAFAPSLLDGDLKFLGELQEELFPKVRGGHISSRHSRPSVDLQLTAMLVEPIVTSAYSPEDEDLVNRRHTARFHFRHSGERPWLASDFPLIEDTAGLELASWRLALGARATSSFPIAFEAAVVRSRRPPTFSGRVESSPGPLVDMGGAFSERSGCPSNEDEAEPDDFVVADGGIVDNIPLAKALRAIADSPANIPTRRRLVYVQPGAPDEVEPPDPARPATWTRRSTVSVVKALAQSHFTAETINEDIAELERHNRAVDLRNALRSETFAGLGAADELTDLAKRAWFSYRAHRAAYDADLIRRLLDDPVGHMGEDPFPATYRESPMPDSLWRAPLSGWTAICRQRLDSDLVTTFAARFDPAPGARSTALSWESVVGNDGWPVLRAGVGPLMRMAALLISWSRELESVTAAGDAKRIFYRSLLFARDVLDRHRRMAWVAGAAAVGRGDAASSVPPELWVIRTIEAANQLLMVPQSVAAAVAAELRAPADAEPTGDISEYTDYSLQVLDGMTPSPQAIDLRRCLVTDVLARTAEQLREQAPEGADGVLHGGLRRVPIDTAVLAALEVVCLPEQLAGEAGEKVEFVRLSAANRTPIAAHFTRLTAAETESELPTRPGHLHPKIKLAGNELANFAAFVDPEWRANDWMWGRLDAVPTLVDLLASRETIERWRQDRGLDQVRQLICGPPTENDWQRAICCNVWKPREATIKAWFDDPINVDVDAARAAIRDALVARRQWDILREELGAGASLSFADLVRKVGEHDIGARTLTDPGSLSHVETLSRLADLAADAAIWNASQLTSTLKSPKIIQRVVVRTANLFRAIAPFIIRRVFAPTREGVNLVARRPGVFVAMLVVIVLATATGWAYSRDWQAALVATLVSAGAALALLVGALWIILGRNRSSPSPPGVSPPRR